MTRSGQSRSLPPQAAPHRGHVSTTDGKGHRARMDASLDIYIEGTALEPLLSDVSCLRSHLARQSASHHASYLRFLFEVVATPENIEQYARAALRYTPLRFDAAWDRVYFMGAKWAQQHSNGGEFGARRGSPRPAPSCDDDTAGGEPAEAPPIMAAAQQDDCLPGPPPTEAPNVVQWDVELADNEQTERLITHLDELMQEVNFYDTQNPRKLLTRVRRFFKRARIDKMGSQYIQRSFFRRTKKFKKVSQLVSVLANQYTVVWEIAIMQWTNQQPIYQQVRDHVVSMIIDGVLKSGDPIPSVRQMAVEGGVNPLTVSKAYQALVDLEIVEKRRGLGMFITDSAKKQLFEIREREIFERRLAFGGKESQSTGH